MLLLAVPEEPAMEELRQRYKEIRNVLVNLVHTATSTYAIAPSDNDIQRAYTYLHNHCAECGCTINSADYARVDAQEQLRVGVVGTINIEESPICMACYTNLHRTRRQFAMHR